MALDERHFVVGVDASDENITVTLPTAVGINGRIYHIKKIDSTINNVTIVANGTETIDGNSQHNLSSQWQRISIISNGTNWFRYD